MRIPRLSRFCLITSSMVMCATSVLAQGYDLDCDDEANRDNPDCLGLPDDQPITNFVPLIAPLVGAGVLAAVGGSSGSTVSTTSTTSTSN